MTWHHISGASRPMGLLLEKGLPHCAQTLYVVMAYLQKVQMKHLKCPYITLWVYVVYSRGSICTYPSTALYNYT